MSYAYAETHNPTVESTPGTITAWAIIAIGGSILASLAGLLVVIAGAAIGSNPDMQAQITNQLAASGRSVTGADVGGVMIGFGIGILIYGIVWAGFNWFLYRQMAQRQQWAWITAVVLLALGILLDLVLLIFGNFIALFHLLLIQAPLAVLLLLSSTRNWVGPNQMQPAYAGAPLPPPPAAPPVSSYAPPPASEPMAPSTPDIPASEPAGEPPPAAEEPDHSPDT